MRLGEMVKSTDCSLRCSPSNPGPVGFFALGSPPGVAIFRFFGGGAKALSRTLFMRSIMLPMPAPSEGPELFEAGLSAGSSGEANEKDIDV